MIYCFVCEPMIWICLAAAALIPLFICVHIVKFISCPLIWSINIYTSVILPTFQSIKVVFLTSDTQKIEVRAR